MDNFSPQIHRDFPRFLLTPYPLNFYAHATPPGLKASLVLCPLSPPDKGDLGDLFFALLV